MVANTDEQLSALVDDECSQAETRSVLVRLAQEPERMARWQRYHLISDALKNNLPTAVDPRFADAVRRAIDTETVVRRFPPAARTRSAATYRPLIGLALAASLAVLAVFGLKLDSGNAIGPGLPSIPTAPVAVIDKAVRNDPLNPKLAVYLVNHNEYASINSVHGVLPYVSMAVDYQASR